MRLADRLWGGVKSLASEPPPQDKPTGTYLSVTLTPREAFEAMLNSNQREAWEGEWGPYDGRPGHHWKSKFIPVAGKKQLWFIEFYGPGDPPDDGVLQCRLCDQKKQPYCFHATQISRDEWDNYKLANSSHPYEAAIAFMTAVRAREHWVVESAGR